MARTKISEYSETAADNTDINNINIAEGCAPSGINNAIREMMKQLKDFQSGTSGDPIVSTSTVTATKLVPTGNVTAGNGMYLPDANTVAFSTDGDERVRVDSSGNVGIGTDTPSALLDVDGDSLVNGLTVGRGGGDVDSNSAVGVNALAANTTGGLNTAIGSEALLNNTTGITNTAIGNVALSENTLGNNNTAIGNAALLSNTTGNFNTSNGNSALRLNTTGINNTAIGPEALRENTTGSNNIAIGLNSGRSASPFTVTNQNSRIVMGNNSHSDAYIRIAWTVTSDKRDKTEFAPIPHGLDFINGLNPTEYQFKAGGREGKADGRRRYGFLAQDVLALEGDNPVIADAEDSENLKLHESYLVPILVNAIKELTARVKELEQK